MTHAYVQGILPIHVGPDPTNVHPYHASTVLGGGGGQTEAEAIESCLRDMRFIGLTATLEPGELRCPRCDRLFGQRGRP